MLLRIASDLHTEFWGQNYSLINQVLPPLPEDPETVLLLAGDIGVGMTESLRYLEPLYDRFDEVVYVRGNHEYLDGADLDEDCPCTVSWNGVVHATLWTDLSRSPMDMVNARRMCEYSTGVFTPEGTHRVHQRTVAQLAELITPGGIVLTHHLPLFQSVTERFKTHPLTSCFASDLSRLIMETKPTLWVHGHTHDSVDYVYDQTRVICNPFGYLNQEVNPNYNPRLTLEIDYAP